MKTISRSSYHCNNSWRRRTHQTFPSTLSPFSSRLCSFIKQIHKAPGYASVSLNLKHFQLSVWTHQRHASSHITLQTVTSVFLNFQRFTWMSPYLLLKSHCVCVLLSAEPQRGGRAQSEAPSQIIELLFMQHRTKLGTIYIMQVFQSARQKIRLYQQCQTMETHLTDAHHTVWR